MSNALTDRQRRFVDEYLVDFNATKAARRAGYSASTSRQIGAENLSKPVIRKEIDTRLERLSNALELSHQAFTEDLIRLCRADIADIFDGSGMPKPVREMPMEFRRGLLKSMKIRVETRANGDMATRIFSIRFADRAPLIYELGKRLGSWK